MRRAERSPDKEARLKSLLAAGVAYAAAAEAIGIAESTAKKWAKRLGVRSLAARGRKRGAAAPVIEDGSEGDQIMASRFAGGGQLGGRVELCTSILSADGKHVGLGFRQAAGLAARIRAMRRDGADDAAIAKALNVAAGSLTPFLMRCAAAVARRAGRAA